MEASLTGPTTTPRDPAPGRLLLVQEFVNSYDVELDADDLADLDALRSWLRERDLVGERDQLAPGDLERARAFREALRSLLEGGVGGAPAAESVQALNAIPAGALLRVSFDEEGRPALEPAGDGLDRALAELLAIIEFSSCEGTWQRLKVCAEDSCRWAFYDRSKNRSGSWCSMAVCGNRAKARSYRERHRGAGAASA